jgi:5-methylcytosine-specific restriction protein A
MKRLITVTYRAVHKITLWRKVRGHTSLENALYGRKDGAPALFDYRARIDYQKHGEPLYAVIWEDNASVGFVVKKDSSSNDGTTRVQVPVDVLLGYEARGGASTAELEAHFFRASTKMAPSDAALDNVPKEEAPVPSLQAEEGAASLEQHLVRERNATLVEAKKTEVLRATGRLACEACGFDFFVTYGAVGKGFCEAHHTKKLGSRNDNETTTLQDLALLCSNCHSVIHRTEPMWSVAALASHLAA